MTSHALDGRPANSVASPASVPVERLPEAASLLLDVVRFTLALLVVVGHASMPWFSTGWPPMLGWADVAVPGFFVLSGFMIRFVTEDRERDPRRYFISRASRMYSVLLPALLLTLLCRAYVEWHSPAYATVLWRSQGAAPLAANLIAHIAFFTQFWGHAVLVSPNLPLWSLGYEVPYYVLFGLLALCSGPWRWLVAGLYLVALGPQVLFLAPLWWSGCWLYRLWQWTRRSRGRSSFIAALAAVTVTLLLFPFAAGAVWPRIAQLPNALTLVGQPHGRATMLAYASGLVSWLLMLLGLCLSDRLRLSKQATWARPMRRLAEGTFTLYLFHYPLLCLVPSTLGHVLRTGWGTTVTVLAIVALSVAASQPIDGLKNWMRRVLNSRFAQAKTD